MFRDVDTHRLYETVGYEVHIEIKDGEFIAIAGPSGSVKSTLLNMIGCLDKPTSGVVFIDGINTDKLSENELVEIKRRKIETFSS